MEAALREKLLKLEELIEQERSYAVNLNVDALGRLQEEKKELLLQLEIPSESCPLELKEVAARLRENNRRNARLLFNTLNFLRQAMSNCCESITPLTYGQRGNRVQNNTLGLLHVGRI
jgi:flagellar biosynthesis/type III secretory pathway chaperone